MPTKIASVLVAGSGVMGRGIAAAFLRAGCRVAILSRKPEAIAGLVEGVAAVGELPEAAPDLIVETIPERVDLKQELYGRIEAKYRGTPIIATNTSGLPLEDLAAKLRHKSRFIGLHYFQPADVMPMVEVCKTPDTDDAVAQAVCRAVEACGQRSILLQRPIVGFLMNRLQHAILHEAYYLIDQGVCGAKEVDEVARHLLGPRMCITGLIEQKDISGLDTHAIVQRTIVPHLNHSAEPGRAAQDLYAQGHYGLKTGRGFYDWSKRDGKAYAAKAKAKLEALIAFLAKQA
jgi:3-hydroxybutyryl-CoA dehydrogenase